MSLYPSRKVVKQYQDAIVELVEESLTPLSFHELHTWIRNRHPEFDPQITAWAVWDCLNTHKINFNDRRRLIPIEKEN